MSTIFPPITDPEQANDLIEKLSDMSRKLEVQELIDVFRDDWDYIIERELLTQYSVESVYDLGLLITKELNILKGYVNEVATVYKQPAQRRVITGEKKSEDGKTETQEDEVYAEAIKASNLDVIMKECNKYTKLSNHTVLQCGFRNGRLDYDLHTFNNVEIIWDPEDWKKLVAVKYYSGLVFPGGNRQPYRAENDTDTSELETSMARRSRNRQGVEISSYEYAWLWVLEDYEEPADVPGEDGSKTFKKGKIYKFEQNSGGKEILVDEEDIEYKDPKTEEVILPFIKVDDHPTIDGPFDYTTGNDVRDANLSLAINIILHSQLLKFQSWKQHYFMATNKEDLPSKIKSNPRAVWLMGNPDGNSQVGTIDNEANALTFWESVLQRANTALQQYGIKIVVKQGGTPESGFKLYVEKTKLREIRADDLPNYRKVEHDLFYITRIVWNYHNPDNLIDIEGKFDINFSELDFPRDPEAVAREKTILITNNVETPVDWIMERDPDLTRAEAEEQYMKNKAFNSSNKVEIEPTKQPGEDDGQAG